MKREEEQGYFCRHVSPGSTERLYKVLRLVKGRGNIVGNRTEERRSRVKREFIDYESLFLVTIVQFSITRSGQSGGR